MCPRRSRRHRPKFHQAAPHLATSLLSRQLAHQFPLRLRQHRPQDRSSPCHIPMTRYLPRGTPSLDREASTTAGRSCHRSCYCWHRWSRRTRQYQEGPAPAPIQLKVRERTETCAVRDTREPCGKAVAPRTSNAKWGARLGGACRASVRSPYRRSFQLAALVGADVFDVDLLAAVERDHLVELSSLGLLD